MDYQNDNQPTTKELAWVQELDAIIFIRAGSHLSSVDTSGYTSTWYKDGLSPEGAFHKWIELHLL